MFSDAYTSWNSDNDTDARTKHNEEVTSVTKSLYEQVIPNFVRLLDSQNIDWTLLWNPNNSTHDIKTTIDNYIGSNEVHLRGINLRHYVSIKYIFICVYIN